MNGRRELRAHCDAYVRNHRDPALLRRSGDSQTLRNPGTAEVRLDDLGLIPALEWQAREVSRNYGIRVNVAADGVSDQLPEEHKTCIYRIVQEALHNCVRHAGASVVRIMLKQARDGVSVLIQDDGHGFRPEMERGLGLVGMEERVTHLGGTFRVDSQLGRGTLLAITLPYEYDQDPVS